LLARFESLAACRDCGVNRSLVAMRLTVSVLHLETAQVHERPTLDVVHLVQLGGDLLQRHDVLTVGRQHRPHLFGEPVVRQGAADLDPLTRCLDRQFFRRFWFVQRRHGRGLHQL
jgi:hypothetical protein